MKIDFVWFVNRRLQTRLAEYYFDERHFAPLSVAERAAFERRVTRACLRRRDAQAPLFEDGEQVVAYRRYASLYVVIGMRKRENVLAALEFAQLLVEALTDVFGGHVSELDLLFAGDKVRSTLDAMLADGVVVETGRSRVVEPVKLIDALQ